MNTNQTYTTTNAVVGPTIASVPTAARKVPWGVFVAIVVIVAVVAFALSAFDTGNNSAGGAAQPAANEQPTAQSVPAK